MRPMVKSPRRLYRYVEAATATAGCDLMAADCVPVPARVLQCDRLIPRDDLLTRATIEIHHIVCEVLDFWELNTLPITDLWTKYNCYRMKNSIVKEHNENDANKESFYGSPPNFPLTKSPFLKPAPGCVY